MILRRRLHNNAFDKSTDQSFLRSTVLTPFTRLAWIQKRWSSIGGVHEINYKAHNYHMPSAKRAKVVRDNAFQEKGQEGLRLDRWWGQATFKRHPSLQSTAAGRGKQANHVTMGWPTSSVFVYLCLHEENAFLLFPFLRSPLWSSDSKVSVLRLRIYPSSLF